MTWITLILNFLKGFLVDVFLKAAETPGVKNEVSTQEGKAKPPPKRFYIGMYRLHNRDKGKK